MAEMIAPSIEAWPSAPKSLDLNDPRIQTPLCTVGQIVQDPDCRPDEELIIVWSPTYRDPTNWGYTRGLICACENDGGDSRNFYHPEEHER